MLQLDNLETLVKKRKRVGRGGSRGGTSGRGHKGQRSRSGGKTGRLGFEGGQMPLSRRLPKRGFNNTQFATPVEIVNLDRLELSFQDGDQVTKEILREKRVVKGKGKYLLKILGTGTLSKKLDITADAASKSAIAAIEKTGSQLRLTKES